jgi:hypothetical protein
MRTAVASRSAPRVAYSVTIHDGSGRTTAATVSMLRTALVPASQVSASEAVVLGVRSLPVDELTRFTVLLLGVVKARLPPGRGPCGQTCQD